MANLADSTRNTVVQELTTGLVVTGTGTLQTDSGATLNVEGAGKFKLAGTAVTSTAAELNTLHSSGVSNADLTNLHAVGGAVPSVVVERTLTETGGSGTYTATVVVPAGATVLDVIFRNTAVWTAATSASMTCGDDDNATGYFTATSVKAAPAADTNGAGAGLSTRVSLGASAGAYKGGAGKYCAAQKTITCTITTVDAGAGVAGRSRLLVEYIAAPTTAAATKA